ncbi:MAG: hypothetical protein Q8P67_19160 [archaeon]|nr:hypothetical protein [archaeon]
MEEVSFCVVILVQEEEEVDCNGMSKPSGENKKERRDCIQVLRSNGQKKRPPKKATPDEGRGV